jgi:hypothetical protein
MDGLGVKVAHCVRFSREMPERGRGDHGECFVDCKFPVEADGLGTAGAFAAASGELITFFSL